MTLSIHPETRVGALLEAYPELETVLISLAPAFAKLKNPLLRRTVAKVATLEQAARIGGIPVRDLVLKLREAAGLPAGAEVAAGSAQEAAADAPPWVHQYKVRFEIDGDELLERGVHPIGKARESVTALRTGEMLLLKTSFRPEPLIATFRQSGHLVHSAETAPGRHATWIARE